MALQKLDSVQGGNHKSSPTLLYSYAFFALWIVRTIESFDM